MAEKIKKAFHDFRMLMRRYEQNIEVVDPQLKNNPELVEMLVNFENSWEKGKTYFLNAKKCTQLVHFSQVIEGTTEKHSKFAEEVESRDAEIFITIPCLLILKSLDEDDKQITKSFYPNMYKEGEESSRLF